MHSSAGHWHLIKLNISHSTEGNSYREVEYGLKLLVQYHFQWRKTTVGWLQSALVKKRHRVRLKSIVLLQNCKMKSKRIIAVLKCTKFFFLRKLTKMSNLILCFSEFLKFFLCPGKAFFIWVLTKSCLSEAASSLRFPLSRFVIESI